MSDRVSSFVQWTSPYAAVGYLFGVLVMLLRVSVALWGGRRLRRSGAPISDPPLLQKLRDQARYLGLRVIPKIAHCGRIPSPVVVGLLRPTILLPTVLISGLTPSQFDAVLAHELDTSTATTVVEAD